MYLESSYRNQFELAWLSQSLTPGLGEKLLDPTPIFTDADVQPIDRTTDDRLMQSHHGLASVSPPDQPES